jgi:hypothetical protein
MMKKFWVLPLAILLTISCVSLAASAPSDVRVTPLLTTAWGQTTVSGNACFNYYTPDSTGYPPTTAGSANNYPSGCVATAMAQVMNYHQWAIAQYPYGTTFTIYADGSAYNPSLKGGTLGGGMFDWMLMQNISTSDPARQEAGRLLHDLGAALSMQYYSWASWGSATDFDYIDGVFIGFTYSNAVTIEGNYVSGGTLMAQSISVPLAQLAITTNLDAGLPVIIGVNDSYLQSGHALVIDGYGLDSSGTMYFHYNFGLPVHGVTPPATNLGWFTLPGVGTTNDSAGYSILDGIAFNVFKAVPIPATGEIISGRITDTSGNALGGIQIHITSPNPLFVPVMTVTNSQGIYAACGIIPNQQYTVTASGAGYATASQICNTGLSLKQWINTGPSGDGYYINTVGNVRTDMTLNTGIDIPSNLPICDFTEFAGLSQYWDTMHTQHTAPDIRYDYNGDWSVNLSDLARLVNAWLMVPVDFRTDFAVIFDTVGAMPAEYPWQYAGSGNWTVVNIPSVAAQSPTIGDNQTTSFILPVKVLPGTPGIVVVNFELECDTELNADIFEFLIDGVVQTSMSAQSSYSGMIPRQMINYQILNVTSPQLMSFEWRYTKDSANSVGTDKVWIGNIMVYAIP